MTSLRTLGLAVALLLLATAAGAHVHLITNGGDQLLWPNQGSNVSFVINATGSDDIDDGSDFLALRLGFEQWSGREGSTLNLVEDTSPNKQARTDFASNDIQLVLFDEDGSTGLFGGGSSSTIALTPVSFVVSSGKIVDADIIFNGRDFDFATDLSGPTVDLWGVATHEAGHFIGLDHSPLGGATMAPATTIRQPNQRQLSDDDLTAVLCAYPDNGASPFFTVEGRVVRAAGGAGVAGASVSLRRQGDGRVIANTLTKPSGDYTLLTLESGTFSVVTAPLNGPVGTSNIISSSARPIETDFEAASIGPVDVMGGGALAPDLAVADTALGSLNGVQPFTVMLMTPDDTDVFGLGVPFGSGATASVPDNPGAVSVTLNGFLLTVDTDEDALPGLYDVRLDSDQGADVYAGHLEVLPPQHAILDVEPATVSALGGDVITVTTTLLTGTPQVLLGDVQALDVEIVGESAVTTTLSVTCPAHDPGVVDFVVVNEGGGEDRIVDGLEFVPGVTPLVDVVFPAAGAAAGGTVVTLTGTGFSAGITASVGGVAPVALDRVDDTRVDLTMPALPAGPHDIVLTNTNDLMSTTPDAYTAVAAPDPTLLAVEPGTVSSDGGEALTITGTGFVDGLVLSVGADPLTGTGGTVLPAVVDSPTQLSATSPPAGPGAFALVVVNPSGQAATLAGGLVVGAQLVGKDKLTGTISAPGEVDVAFLDVLSNTTLTVTAKATKGSALLAKLVVRNEEGAVLASSDPADAAYDPLIAVTKGKKTTLRKLLVATLGTVSIEITGLDGTTGGYKLSFKEKVDKTALKLAVPKKEATPLGPETVLVMIFDAKAGSLLSGKLTSKDGATPVILSLEDPDDNDVSDDPEVQAAVSTNASGTQLKLKKLPLGSFGQWVLTIGSSSGDGTVAGKISVKLPKSKMKFVEE